MLTLTSGDLIASGGHRSCYYHPQNPNRCIKILHSDSAVRDETREIQYFNVLSRRKINWQMIARLYGKVETSLGSGVEFDLIRDNDGAVSRPLAWYLEQHDPALNQAAVVATEQVVNNLLDQNVIFRDLIAENILLQKLGENRFNPVVVDGIGHNDFIPLCNYSAYLGRKKNLRKWHRDKHNWFGRFNQVNQQIFSFAGLH